MANQTAVACNRGAMDDDELIAAWPAATTARCASCSPGTRRGWPPGCGPGCRRPDVEDVLQETFLAAWRGARGYRPQGTPGGWLWVIARRQAALLLRRRGPAGLELPASGDAAGAGGRPGRGRGGPGRPGRRRCARSARPAAPTGRRGG